MEHSQNSFAETVGGERPSSSLGEFPHEPFGDLELDHCQARRIGQTGLQYEASPTSGAEKVASQEIKDVDGG